jgi:hypothetical protein
VFCKQSGIKGGKENGLRWLSAPHFLNAPVNTLDTTTLPGMSGDHTRQVVFIVNSKVLVLLDLQSKQLSFFDVVFSLEGMLSNGNNLRLELAV